jgi:4'-phosphopantetheinyl transferase
MNANTWPPPPNPAQFEHGYAQVYLLSLDHSQERRATLRAHLSPDEHARADRLRYAEGRDRFIAGRGQVREILAGYLDCSPSEVAFSYNEHGKPILNHPDGWIPPAASTAAALPAGETTGTLNTRLFFNLAHSHNTALLAIACGVALGVDLEYTGREVDYTNIARRFFADGEVAELLQLPAEQQRRAFFNCWVRKEAYIKALGGGLSIPLDQFQVSLSPGQPAQLLACTETFDLAEFSLFEIEMGEVFTAALAARGPLNGLRCWRWER